MRDPTGGRSLPKESAADDQPIGTVRISGGPRGLVRPASLRDSPNGDLPSHGAGASGQILTPVRVDEIAGARHETDERRRLAPEVDELQDQFTGRDLLREVMGPSRQVEKILQQIGQVADSSLTVLIQGETGTGKELVARAIHRLSPRRLSPFNALDCGAIPDTLIESELFGYERGAFTGADQRKEGHFQRAVGGSLFLDEIVNLPLSTQPKLLRALQEREVQALGGKHPVPVDVRIIASTNVPLEREIRAGRFRQDLYYRLNQFGIHLPPLRERLEDIPYLASCFLIEASQELGRPVHGISDEAIELLLRYPWPGNVRELQNVIRKAVVLSQDDILPEHLSVESPVSPSAPLVSDGDRALEERSLKQIAAEAAAEAERRAIRRALEAAQGNKSAVARRLGVDFKTLHLKMKRYGICAREFQAS